MKYSNYIGIAAALLLIVACFLPWAYYSDIDKTFTGFFSEQNRYGKPGKLLIAFSVLSILFFIIPKIWAKRLNLFVATLTVAFSVRSFMLFSGCYRGYCPEKKIGLFLILICAIVMLISSLLPNMKLKEKNS
ncbi:MAG TPA: hypothetical protein VKT28_07995 [Puia sp.]|nr:hypothetical protein [Puia sp.]